VNVDATKSSEHGRREVQWVRGFSTAACVIDGGEAVAEQ